MSVEVVVNLLGQIWRLVFVLKIDCIKGLFHFNLGASIVSRCLYFLNLRLQNSQVESAFVIIYSLQHLSL